MLAPGGLVLSPGNPGSALANLNVYVTVARFYLSVSVCLFVHLFGTFVLIGSGGYDIISVWHLTLNEVSWGTE